MIIKQVMLTRISRRVGMSANISFDTMLNQSTDDMAKLDSLFQRECVIAIKEGENPISEDLIKELDSLELPKSVTKKSHSKRLRDVLWLVLRAEKGRKPNDDEWNDYYSNQMEKIISHFKEKIK